MSIDDEEESCKNTETQIEELNRYTEKIGWKLILLLQFQPQFQIAIYGGILIGVFLSVTDASYALSSASYNVTAYYMVDRTSILFAFDIFYFLDLLAMTIYKNTYWPEVKVTYQQRHSLIVLIEYLSLIPFDALYYSNHDALNFYYFRLRYVSRIIRILNIARIKRNISSSSTNTKYFVIFFVILGFLAMTLTCIIMPIHCKRECNFPDEPVYYSLFYLNMQKMTGVGLGTNEHFSTSQVIEYWGLSVVSYSMFLFISYYTSRLACKVIPQGKYRYTFVHKFLFIKKRLFKWVTIRYRQYNYQRSLQTTVDNFFKILWKNRHSISREIPARIIPFVIFKEIALDMCWDAFKHSHLFRNEKTYFIRSLSILMKHTFYIPGEIIYRKHERKSRMIYLVTGIMQILSEENGETPLISLSGGTCIGESTLIIDYPSTCTVVSKTYCEVTILERKDFMKVSKLYPLLFRNLISSIKSRYEESKMNRNLFKSQNNLLNCNENLERITTVWLKRTLYRLLHNDKVRSRRDKNLDQDLKKIVFYPKYIDLLVITEELELVTDSVFLKKKFPFIFQPDSTFLKGWNLMISVLACIIVFVYPYVLCNAHSLQIGSYVIFYIIISFMWAMDVYIQMSTAIKTRDIFYTQISKIIYFRLSTVSFLVDIFSVVPFGPFLLLINGRITSDTFLLAEVHKLLKFYKFRFFFSKSDQVNASSMVLNNYLKFLIFAFLLFYYTAAILFYIVCEHSACPIDYLKTIKRFYKIEADAADQIFLQFYATSTLFVSDLTVFPLLKWVKPEYIYMIIILQLLYATISMYMLSDAIAVETLNQQENHEFIEFVSSMEVMMKKFSFPCDYQKKIWIYLRNQYYFGGGIDFLHPNLVSEVMSNNLFLIYRQVIYGKYVHNFPFFQNLPEPIIIDVARTMKITNYPAGEVITYADEICKEMHLILFGYCQMINRSGTIKIVKPMECFSLLEMFLKIPTINTVTALTDCKLISLTCDNFSKIITKYPEIERDIKRALQYDIIVKDIKKMQEDLIARDTVKFTESKIHSFRRFGYKKKKKDNLDFHKGFNAFFVFFKFILLRYTITSNGKFLFWWEVCRCIFAFSTNFLTSITNICTDCFLFYILVGLDMTAWIDIYVRHHICYFNKVGLEISHPMSTAIYYWKHGFILDVLGSAPIDYLVSNKVKMYIRMNRLIQIHRIFGFFAHLNANNLSRSNVLDVLKYLPLTLLVINYISSLFLYSTCDIDYERNESAVENCAAHFFISHRMDKAYNRFNAHGASLMLTTSMLALIPFTNIRVKMPLEMVYISGMVLIGYVFTLWLTAKMVAHNFYRNTDLTSYQEAMKELLTFLDYRRIDKNIKKEVIEHFEHKWQKKKGKDIQRMLKSFGTSFKEDILYEVFGKQLQASSIFRNASKSLLKNLLLDATHDVYLRKGIIYRVNDIHGIIFFLLKGQIEVLGPDYNKLLVLTNGSLFGNLDNCLYSRQTLMMVAKSNVEVLKISSIYFHSTLSKFDNLYLHFRRLTSLNVDYLESHYAVNIRNTVEVSDVVKKGTLLSRIYVRLNPVYKYNTALAVCETIVIVLVGFVGFHIEAYQKITQDHSPTILMILYLLDFLHISRIYVIFHRCYIDDYGSVIRSRNKIAQRYINDFFGFYLDLISALPLEIVSLIFINSNHFWTILTWCRSNRFVRVVLVLHTLKSSKEKLHINVVIMRVLFTLTWLTIIIQLMACTLSYIQIMYVDVAGNDYMERLNQYGIMSLLVLYATTGAAMHNIILHYDPYMIVMLMFIIVICRFIIAMYIAESCSTLEAINKAKNKYEEYATDLCVYMKEENISTPLREQVQEYVQLLWNNHKGVQYPNLLREAPYYLVEATMNAMFGFHIRRHKTLKYCHMDLVRQLAAAMDVIIFFPENIIAHEGDVDESMYFIHEGEVDVLTEDSLYTEVSRATLHNGETFGLSQGLYARCGHNYTYKVKKYSVVLALQRNKWIHMLDFFPASKALIYDKEEAKKYA